jgi:hypothetical protein
VTNLQHLDLKATCVSDDGIESLVFSKNISLLNYLDISDNYPKITNRSL